MRSEKSRTLVTSHLLSDRSLEPDVLKCLSRSAVEVSCKPVVAATGGEVAPRDPRGGAMSGRAELREAGLGCREGRLGLVEAVLLEQRPPEDELRAADLVEVVLVSGGLEEAQRVPRLLFGLLDVAGSEMDLGQRGHRLRRVCVATGLEGDAERLLQEADRLVGLAEEEVQAAEIVRQLADVDLVGELLVGSARLLGVVPREHPVPLAVGDERRLEVGGADRARVVRVLGELKRALDVLARC